VGSTPVAGVIGSEKLVGLDPAGGRSPAHPTGSPMRVLVLDGNARTIGARFGVAVPERVKA